MSHGRRKKKGLTLNLPEKVVYSLIGLGFISLGVLILVSFTGQGQILTRINDLVAEYFGFTTLFLPFLCFSAGVVMFQSKRMWGKPHVLLGACIMMLSVMILGQAGSIGSALFSNLSRLITVPGLIGVMLLTLLGGFMVLTHYTGADLLEWLMTLWPQKQFQPRSDEEEQDERDSISDDKDAPRRGILGWLFRRRESSQGFTVHDNLLNENSTSASMADQPRGGTSGSGSQPVAQPATQPAPATPKPLSAAKALELNLLKEDPKAAAGSGPKVASTSEHLIWEYPPLKLLSDKVGGEADRGDVKGNASVIERTLASFGIKAKVAEVNFGPAVTQYALEIALGTKLSRITSLSTDLALALAAPTGQIRIEAPIAGKSLVGIEVPNHAAQFVTLRTMLQSDKMKKMKSKLAVALGLDVSGQPVIADIAKMPHALIAGATGSGKSVAINTFLCSILFRASPAEVKLILVDPKRVELTGYNDIPHLLTPVIVEPPKVVAALKWATHEMERRYKQLAEVNVKHIDNYNELAGFQAMPSIVIVIDELADIMLFAPQDVEDSITRIAQMARAVGIHLILATQRPSVDIITGLIKANVPTRIAFNVSSMMDSRVVLDAPGAEKLLGRGDMLYIPPEQAKPTRIQGTYVSDAEIKHLVEFVKEQGQKPEYEEEITNKYTASSTRGGSGGGGGIGGGDGEEGGKDPLFDEAAKLFSQFDKASSSLIQRRLSVGYARAARILDQLYLAGLVGPAEGSKPRDVNMVKVREYLAGGSSRQS